MSTNDVDFFVTFAACKEMRSELLYLLKRCIKSARREGLQRIFVIDGSLEDAKLKPDGVNAEIIRNKKHGLGFAYNIAIEHAEKTMFFVVAGSILGVSLIRNMLVEKHLAEEQLGKPVALLACTTAYPTENEWFLTHGRGECGWPIEKMKIYLKDMGFNYTDEGIAISNPSRTKWSEGDLPHFRNLSAGFLIDRNQFYEIGGADERCFTNDYDIGMRWLSFGRYILRSYSVRIHRICGTTFQACPQLIGYANAQKIDEKDAPTTDPFGAFFRAWMKYDDTLYNLFAHHAFGEPLLENPSLYERSLKSPFKEEYKRLKKKPFFLGRK